MRGMKTTAIRHERATARSTPTLNHSTRFRGYTRSLMESQVWSSRPGIATEKIFGASSTKICWAEFRWNSRWAREDYSSIIVYDISSGKKNKLTKTTSYFSPIPNDDGTVIAALHDNDLQQWSIHLLNAETGEVQRELPNPNNYYFSYLNWSEDEKSILTGLRDSVGQMAIGRQFVEDGSIEILSEWTYQPVGRPVESDGLIYFTRSEGVQDRICRLGVESETLEVLEYSGSSRYQPVPLPNGEVVFAEFSLKGKRLRSIAPEQESWVPEEVEKHTNDYLKLDAGDVNILDNLPDRDYEVSKYGLFRQPIYIHSWRPIFDDPVYSFEFQSLNVLQSISWNTGIRWFSNNNDWGPYTELTLGMWYPEILFGYTGLSRVRTSQQDGERFKWFEHSVNAGLRIPFRALHNRFILSGSATSRIQHLTSTGDFDFNLNYLSHRLVIEHRQRVMPKHPITRLSQRIDIEIPHAIDGDTASQFQVKTDFTIPSLIRNHVIWLQFDYRRELLSNTYRFGDSFNYSRGYSAFESDWIYRVGVNYQLPLVHPDWGFAGIIYFKPHQGESIHRYFQSWNQ